MELGPPPGSNATTGVINAPTPQDEEDDRPSRRVRQYTCGLAFGPESSQEQLYESLGVDLLESALDGYASTLFAYGPRGSGKRYTIEGAL